MKGEGANWGRTQLNVFVFPIGTTRFCSDKKPGDISALACLSLGGSVCQLSMLGVGGVNIWVGLHAW